MVEIAESASDDLNTSVGDRDQVAKQDEGHVATEVVRGVGWIRLINPHRANALTPAMIAELADAWRAFDADPSVSVIMLTGHGDRHFCAGSDVRKLAESTVYGSHEYKVEWPSPRCGRDNVTFESDYPHTDGTWPDTVEVARRELAHLTPLQREKVVRLNAIRMLSLESASQRPA